ncbi:plb1 [Bugula neritina]|uniref:Plb1 n=1 Tax=Bugula neritina TaxID=10212 RepID=A0A7J7KCP8_BUGNE|nr:plb1 [Bugula neritina]
MVNFVEMYGIEKVREMVRFSPKCERNARLHYCPCVTKSDGEHIERKYAAAIQDLVNSGRYDTKKDFTVVIQPFLREMSLSTCRHKAFDSTYLAPDCVHWSSKGHSAMGVALWNSMITKVGDKQERVHINDQAKCPYTKFIPTRLNISDTGIIPIPKPKFPGGHNNSSFSKLSHHISVFLLTTWIFNVIYY